MSIASLYHKASELDSRFLDFDLSSNEKMSEF